jgi:hypothetical protein
MEAGQKRSPGRRTARHIVELGERQAFRADAIDVGRFDFGAEATDVRVTQVVGENQHDVRPRRGGGEGRTDRKRATKD